MIYYGRNEQIINREPTSLLCTVRGVALHRTDGWCSQRARENNLKDAWCICCRINLSDYLCLGLQNNMKTLSSLFVGKGAGGLSQDSHVSFEKQSCLIQLLTNLHEESFEKFSLQRPLVETHECYYGLGLLLSFLVTVLSNVTKRFSLVYQINLMRIRADGYIN